MNYREIVTGKTYLLSYKSIFVSLTALFALSGIAWASVEFSSASRNSPSDGANPSQGGNYPNGRLAETSRSYGDDAAAVIPNGAIGFLPSGALISARAIHGSWLNGEDPSRTFSLYGARLIEPGNPQGGVYNRVAVSLNPPLAPATPAATPFFYNNNSGGGGGGGGGKNDAANQEPASTQTDTGSTTNTLIIGQSTLSGEGQAPMGPVPEPGTYVMLATGLAMLVLAIRRSKGNQERLHVGKPSFNPARTGMSVPDRISAILMNREQAGSWHQTIAILLPLKAPGRPVAEDDDGGPGV